MELIFFVKAIFCSSVSGNTDEITIAGSQQAVGSDVVEAQLASQKLTVDIERIAGQGAASQRQDVDSLADLFQPLAVRREAPRVTKETERVACKPCLFCIIRGSFHIHDYSGERLNIGKLSCFSFFWTTMARRGEKTISRPAQEVTPSNRLGSLQVSVAGHQNIDFTLSSAHQNLNMQQSSVKPNTTQ